MGTYFTIDGDPLEVSATGALLRSMGDSFHTEVQAVLTEIEAIEAEQPWGNDKYGKEYKQHGHDYVPDGFDVPLRVAAREGMEDAGKALEKIGDTVVRAMTQIQHTDGENASEISAAAEE